MSGSPLRVLFLEAGYSQPVIVPLIQPVFRNPLIADGAEIGVRIAPPP